MVVQKQLQKLRERWRKRTGYYRFTEGRDLSEVTHRVLRKLIALPEGQSSRAGETKELSPHQFYLPFDRYGEPNATTILPGRRNNPFATVAETLWVYAGRNDIETLRKWLPRVVEYSDDGRTWSSGYGPRLRAWVDHNLRPFDQIEVVLRRLKKNPESRQAVLVLWDPAADGTKEGSKDYVCNILVHFLIRNGGLNVHVTTRSNDIIYGVAINVFEWCFLGNYLAEQLRIPFRHYYQSGDSLHLYDTKSEAARRTVSHPYFPIPFVRIPASAPAVSRAGVAPDEMKRYCNTVYNAAYGDAMERLDAKYLEGLPSRLADLAYALRAEGKLGTTGSEYLAELKAIRYVPLLFSLLDAGIRRRREALWLCKGFSDLWLNTNSEIAAARYLSRLYSLNESHHVQQKGNGHNAVRPAPGGSPVQSGGTARL